MKTLHQLNIDECIAWHERQAHELDIQVRTRKVAPDEQWREDRDRHRRFSETVKQLNAECNTAKNVLKTATRVSEKIGEVVDLNQDAIEAAAAEQV